MVRVPILQMIVLYSIRSFLLVTVALSEVKAC
jgi:hypothetical protein